MDEVVAKRSQSLYDQDRSDLEVRKSHENKAVTKAYEEFLEKPNSEVAHKYLHTHYSQKMYTKE